MSIELFITIVIFGISYAAYIFLKLFLRYQQVMQKHDEFQQQELKKLQEGFKKEHVTEDRIVERIGFLGLYDGKEIPSHVRLEDGRLFEYVSLTIKSPQGYFRSTVPDTLHLRVDENLLYRLAGDK